VRKRVKTFLNTPNPVKLCIKVRGIQGREALAQQHPRMRVFGISF
jgi:hypothetical protein